MSGQDPPSPDEHQQRQLETMGIQDARPDEQAEEIRQTLMAFISSSDLQEGTKNILENYASKSFILGYLQDDEVNELKWELRIDHEYYKAMHPPRSSKAQGETRAWINDSYDDTLKPLSDIQEMQLATFFKGVWTNITRARGMKQQEILKTQISRSEVERGEDQGKKGLKQRLLG